MRVLVIGATGYLGSHITRHLSATGHAVTGLSRTPDGDSIVSGVGAIAMRGDLIRLDSVIALARDHDAVIYAAQLPLQEEYDVLATLIAGISSEERTLIFTSGTGVLSQRTDGHWSEDTFAEDDSFVPSRYIGQRLITETLVRTMGASGLLRAMVIRPPMIWGHGGCGHLRHCYRDAQTRGEVGYLGPGLNLYSSVHVDDLAEVYRLALERGTAGALYHAVSGETGNRTLARSVADDCGVPARSITFAEGIERWGKFETLIGMATCSRTRSPRTRTELGWRPQHEDILRDIGHPAYRAPSRLR